jgi:hypothetical protein
MSPILIKFNKTIVLGGYRYKMPEKCGDTVGDRLNGVFMSRIERQ